MLVMNYKLRAIKINIFEQYFLLIHIIIVNCKKCLILIDIFKLTP